VRVVGPVPLRGLTQRGGNLLRPAVFGERNGPEIACVAVVWVMSLGFLKQAQRGVSLVTVEGRDGASQSDAGGRELPFRLLGETALCLELLLYPPLLIGAYAEASGRSHRDEGQSGCKDPCGCRTPTAQTNSASRHGTVSQPSDMV